MELVVAFDCSYPVFSIVLAGYLIFGFGRHDCVCGDCLYCRVCGIVVSFRALTFRFVL